jgi:hypothetical protein
MSEISYTIQKKKQENSKCLYKSNEHGSQIFIFEIVLKDDDDELNTIRKIKKGNQGNLISSNDSILYQKIDQVNISVLDTNNINDQINAKISIDHSATYTTYVSHEIYLEFNKNSKGLLECNYNIPSY